MNQPKRILVIKLSSLGDVFHALPAVNNLKVALGAEVDWVTQPEYVELVRCFPVVSRVIVFPRRAFWSEAGHFLHALRETQYDYVIDFQGLLKSALVARFARGRKKLGPSFHREGAGLFYDDVAASCDKNRHAVEENLDVVRFLGLPVIPVAFPVTIMPKPVIQPEPRVAIVPVSRRANKNWPLSYFTETARQLRTELNASIFLFGGATDRMTCEQIRVELESTRGNGLIRNLAGETSLVEMGAWFKQMNLAIVNDSGPLHMAVALGVPVVTMFGPTDPVRTGPYGPQHVVCISDVACRPCFGKVCPLPSVECMGRIEVSKVVEASKAILNRNSCPRE